MIELVAWWTAMHLGRSLRRLCSFPTQDHFYCLDVQRIPSCIHQILFVWFTHAHFCLLVTWPVHILLIAWPALLHIQFFFSFWRLHFCQFTVSSYMTNLVTWWIAHGWLSRANQIVFLLGLVSLSWCSKAFKLGPATYFCFLHTHQFLSFSCLADTLFAYHVTHFAIQRIWSQFFGGNCIFSISQPAHK